ncbi:hypothetical protein HCJ76_44415 [Streptomyces sp. MC1]|uniref:hypothetical protein n=1 Tax=Streptomyces sp. MC1 TaxID=295105 RepID=UPI0018C95B0D|nr:hypothetical protein [Streptomyces sp. MC1]MBG7704930.1 hypothetical protein [Streptomyces sp. MC1]
MDYRFSVKALPPSVDPAAQDQDPAAAQPPPELQPPHQDDARPWAGDEYDEGDESDPAQAFAAFSGPNNEQAWLDKADDGTLTGWVRDETGQVYRYADPDAWAIDVDDAGMAQTGGTGGQADPGAQQPAGGAPVDPNADPAAADPNAADPNADPAAMDPAAGDQAAADPAATDPAAADDGGLSLDYGTADEAVPADPAAADDADPAEQSADGTDSDEDPKAKKKRKPWE